MDSSNQTEDDTEIAFPTPFQRKTFWRALTALSIVALGAVLVGLIMLGGTVLSYLQPVLVPLAVAGIIAYLLEPVVEWLVKKKWKPNTAMLTVYIGFIVGIVVLVVSVIVPTFGEAHDAYDKRETYRKQIVSLTKKGVDSLDTRFGSLIDQEHWDKGMEKISKGAMDIAPKFGTWVWDKLRGAVGFFGYLLGFMLVPIYLYYFLREGHKIAESWSDYLPLKASGFKDEVVETLKEVNGYLISFFRGQMVVSLIDGALVAVALYFFGLPYALLIGVFLAILGLIPYVGNLMVMVPAILIAIAHFSETEKGIIQGDSPAVVDQVAKIEYVVKSKTQVAEGVVSEVFDEEGTAEVLVNVWHWMPHVWFYPLAVLLIFVTLQQINGLVTAPKIVGDSVGLHPLTVIFSILFWSLVLGGLLGALLAVPLTAGIKVIFRRYIWEKRLGAAVERRLAGNDLENDTPDDDGDDSETALA